MSVQPEVLNWLFRVLSSNGYYNHNRAYSDIAQCLATYPSLSPRTDVYTFENGASALLVKVGGTLPVLFRGITYRFPISIWIPASYPKEGPTVYVTPTAGMMIRPGQHVSGEGKVYHPYLSHWIEASERSTLVDFLSILHDVFAKEPPVISKQAQQQHAQARLGQNVAPPPLPPLPPELSTSPHPPETVSDHPMPPPPPPKPYATGSHMPQGQQAQTSLRAEGVSSHPPPAERRTSPYGPTIPDHQTRQAGYSHPSSAAMQLPVSNGNVHQVPSPPPPPPKPYQQFPARMPSAAQSPMPQSQHQMPYYQRSVPLSPSLPSPGHPPNNLASQQYWQPQPPQASHDLPPQSPEPPAQPNPPTPKPAAPIDLLTSPLDIPLPTTTPASPPPIPPNPEKDALLRLISSTLNTSISCTQSQNQIAQSSLQSQFKALQTASHSLMSELSALESLSNLISSNTRILHDSIAAADTVMVSARKLEAPPIDEILVAPSRVGNQLYELCAEELACADALAGLSRALDKGRIGVDVWMRATRSVGRERFLKRALMKKIRVGMGLNEG